MNRSPEELQPKWDVSLLQQPSMMPYSQHLPAQRVTPVSGLKCWLPNQTTRCTYSIKDKAGVKSHALFSSVNHNPRCIQDGKHQTLLIKSIYKFHSKIRSFAYSPQGLCSNRFSKQKAFASKWLQVCTHKKPNCNMTDISTNWKTWWYLNPKTTEH